MDQQPSMSREVSMWIVRYLRTMSRPCLLLVMVMHPYRWSLKVTMASSISATIYVSRLSAAIYEP